jgi:hypothetical protein
VYWSLGEIPSATGENIFACGEKTFCLEFELKIILQMFSGKGK